MSTSSLYLLSKTQLSSDFHPLTRDPSFVPSSEMNPAAPPVGAVSSILHTDQHCRVITTFTTTTVDHRQESGNNNNPGNNKTSSSHNNSSSSNRATTSAMVRTLDGRSVGWIPISALVCVCSCSSSSFSSHPHRDNNNNKNGHFNSHVLHSFLSLPTQDVFPNASTLLAPHHPASSSSSSSSLPPGRAPAMTSASLLRELFTSVGGSDHHHHHHRQHGSASGEPQGDKTTPAATGCSSHVGTSLLLFAFKLRKNCSPAGPTGDDVIGGSAAAADVVSPITEEEKDETRSASWFLDPAPSTASSSDVVCAAATSSSSSPNNVVARPQQQQPTLPLTSEFDVRHLVVFSGSGASTLGRGGSGFVLVAAVRSGFAPDPTANPALAALRDRVVAHERNLRQRAAAAGLNSAASAAPHPHPHPARTRQHPSRASSPVLRRGELSFRDLAVLASAAAGGFPPRSLSPSPLPNASSFNNANANNNRGARNINNFSPATNPPAAASPSPSPSSTSGQQVVSPNVVAVKVVPLPGFASSKFEHLRREVVIHALTSNHPHFIKLFGVYPIYASPVWPGCASSMLSPQAMTNIPPVASPYNNNNNNNSNTTTTTTASSARVVAVALIFSWCDGGSLESLMASSFSASTLMKVTTMQQQQEQQQQQLPLLLPHPSSSSSFMSYSNDDYHSRSVSPLLQQQQQQRLLQQQYQSNTTNNNNTLLNDASSLDDVSLAVAPLREFELVSVARAVASGLHYLHNELGVAHRDIKPGNILLSSFGEIVISDLGIAKQVVVGSGGSDFQTPNPKKSSSGSTDNFSPPSLSASPLRSSTPPTAQQQQGTLCGTPLYVAQEIYEQMFLLSNPANRLFANNNQSNNNNANDSPPTSAAAQQNPDNNNNNNNNNSNNVIDLRKADMFSFGVVLRSLIFSNVQEVPDDVLRNPSVSEEFEKHIHSSISSECRLLISQLLNPNPKERMSCEDFLQSPLLEKYFGRSARNQKKSNKYSSSLLPALASICVARMHPGLADEVRSLTDIIVATSSLSPDNVEETTATATAAAHHNSNNDSGSPLNLLAASYKTIHSSSNNNNNVKPNDGDENDAFFSPPPRIVPPVQHHHGEPQQQQQPNLLEQLIETAVTHHHHPEEEAVVHDVGDGDAVSIIELARQGGHYHQRTQQQQQQHQAAYVADSEQQQRRSSSSGPTEDDTTATATNDEPSSPERIEFRAGIVAAGVSSSPNQQRLATSVVHRVHSISSERRGDSAPHHHQGARSSSRPAAVSTDNNNKPQASTRPPPPLLKPVPKRSV